MLKYPGRVAKNHEWRTRPRPRLLVAMVAVLCCAIWGQNPSSSRGAGLPGWLTTQAMAPILPGRQDAARHEAIALALQQAVDKVVTSQVSAQTLLVQLKLSGQIAGAIPYARIVEQQMLEEKQQPCGQGDAADSTMCYWVRLKAEVVEEAAGLDPHFRIAAVLNQSFFKDGDAMQITMTATDDCYVYIFDLLENGQVMRLLPNQYSRRNCLKADEPLTFPGDRDAGKGIRLVAHGLENRPVTQEAFYFLAVKQPLERSATDKIQEGLFQRYGEHETFMHELIRQVVRIPLDQRAEAMATYQIVKPK